MRLTGWRKMLLVQSQAYRAQYGFSSVVLFPVNLYGAARQLRSDDIARHSGADPQSGRSDARRPRRSADLGDGTPTREFLYVADCAEGIVLCDRALRRQPAGQPRIGSEKTRSRPWRSRSETSWVSGAALPMTKAGQTVSRVARSTVAAPTSCLAFALRRASKPGCAAPSTSIFASYRHEHPPRTHHRHHWARRLLSGGVLLRKGYEVHGIVRRSSSFNTGRLEAMYQDPHVADYRLKLHYGDMVDSSVLGRILHSVRPDEVYNLAAQSHVRSVVRHAGIHKAMSSRRATTRLLEALRELGPNTRFYQASSSEMFGDPRRRSRKPRRFVRVHRMRLPKSRHTKPPACIAKPMVCLPPAGSFLTTKVRVAAKPS